MRLADKLCIYRWYLLYLRVNVANRKFCITYHIFCEIKLQLCRREETKTENRNYSLMFSAKMTRTEITA
jgi:hypothetical protein